MAAQQGHHAELRIFGASFVLIVFVRASIEEGVSLPGVAMEVAEDKDSPLIM